MTQAEKLPVRRLGWPVSNAWLLPATPLGPILIDTGFAGVWPSLVVGLKRHGVDPARLAAVILTHRHCDHAGNAARLQRRYGTQIYAHRADAQLLSGGERPRLRSRSLVVGGMCEIENHFPVQLDRVEPLEQGDEIAGLEVHWVPGHTVGSIFLYHRPSQTLFSGDGLLNAVPPWTLRTALSLPWTEFSDDPEGSRRNLARFFADHIPVRTLCAGHGPPRCGLIEDEVASLLAGPERAAG